MFCKLEQFQYSRGGMGTSHSTSGRLFDVMYLTLTVPDSCRDTLELLIVVLLVLVLHLSRNVFNTHGRTSAVLIL